MPAVMITMSCPRASTALIADWRRTLSRLSTVRKCGEATARATQRTASPSRGPTRCHHVARRVATASNGASATDMANCSCGGPSSRQPLDPGNSIEATVERQDATDPVPLHYRDVDEA